jgi:hypothetical protein
VLTYPIAKTNPDTTTTQHAVTVKPHMVSDR